MRVLFLVGGLLGAVVLSQFPEFSQQYVQRLGGAVDELTVIVDKFDRTATRSGLTRDRALQQMGGTQFLDGRQVDMRGTIERRDRLAGDLAALRFAAPFERFSELVRFTDQELAITTAKNFRPAIPLNTEAAGFAAMGYFVGWIVFVVLFGGLKMLLFRRRHAYA